MPDAAHLLAFLLAALALSVLPGPGMLYVLARSVAGGRAVGLRSTMGTGTGGLVHVFAATIGLSAALAASATAFSVIKYGGAVYLVWLGARQIFRPGDPPQGGGTAIADARAFRQGVVTEALNPKTALFFLTFLPQFCQPQNGPVPLQLALLGLVCVALNVSADLVVAFTAGSIGRHFRKNARLWRRQRQATGGLLMGLGIYTAARAS
jgi:threonine/homoserine/homoserine lactone efflux protein